MVVLNVTVSPDTESLRAWRNEPTPLSPLLTTVIVANPYWYADIAWYDNAVWLSMEPVAISNVQSPPSPVRLLDAAISRPVNCARESTKLSPLLSPAVLHA